MKDGYPGNHKELGYCISVLHGRSCSAFHSFGYSCMVGASC